MFSQDPFSGPSPMFDFMFTLVPALVVIGFMVVIGSIIYNATKNAGKPIISRQARIISRRTYVWGENSSTNYYITFEFPDGAREELSVASDQFGFLVEGDEGVVRSQGDSFKGFDRIIRQAQ